MSFCGEAIDTRSIYQTSKKLRREISTRDAREFYTRMIDQMIDAEIGIIEAVTNVMNVRLGPFQKSLSSADQHLLKETVDSRFYNYNVLLVMAGNVDAVFYSAPTEKGNVSRSLRINTMITDLKKIGGESVEGYAFSGDLDGEKSMFVVKVPQDPSDEGLLHELFVGLLGTNKLRKKIPNFSFVYGGFRCSPPIVDDDGNVIDWCSKDSTVGKSVPYVIYESINNSVSASKYVATASPSQFLSIFYQITLATMIAEDSIGFTHYDLHTENVLIRSVSGLEEFQIPYTHEGKSYYFRSDAVATIIDYGRSHIKFDWKNDPLTSKLKLGYNGTSYGVHMYEMIPYFTFPDAVNGIGDVYKFLMFCMLEAYRSKNYDVLDLCVYIFKFFNDREDPIRVLNQQWDLRYATPLLKQSCNLVSLMSLLMNDLRDVLPVYEMPDEELTILGCNARGAYCKTYSKVVTEAGFKKDPLALTFFDYYDSGNSKGFDYEKAKKEFSDELTDLIETLEERFSEVTELKLRGKNIEEYKVLESVKKEYSDVFSITSSVEKIELYLKVGTYVADAYNDTKLITELGDVGIENYRAEMCSLIKQAVANYDYINEETSKRRFEVAVRRNKDLLWYVNSSSDVLGLESRINCREECPNGVCKKLNPRSWRSKEINTSLMSESPARSLMI